MGDPTRCEHPKNYILDALSPGERQRLRPYMECISCELGKVLFRPAERADSVYFPLERVAISIVNPMANGRDVEVGLIGSEGLAGVWAALGESTHPYRGIIQSPGQCCRLPVEVFRQELQRSRELQERFTSYLRYMLIQLGQTAACNRVHSLDKRLARRLLMMSLRVETDNFPATHEFLSFMLGSCRSEVTIAAGILRRAGLIEYHRGAITILDKMGLEGRSCECYSTVDKIPFKDRDRTLAGIAA
jgi:CRP-like cAMP-binding protein